MACCWSSGKNKWKKEYFEQQFGHSKFRITCIIFGCWIGSAREINFNEPHRCFLFFHFIFNPYLQQSRRVSTSQLDTSDAPLFSSDAHQHQAPTLATSAAYKDNKILYSNKTKPKRTKSQEHLPTHKRNKKSSRESRRSITRSLWFLSITTLFGVQLNYTALFLYFILTNSFRCDYFLRHRINC